MDTPKSRAESDRRFIDKRIDEIKKAILDFGSGEEKKFELEKWAVQKFTSDIGAPAPTGDLERTTVDEVDCLYLDARFQVKEIQDQGRKRHDEFKAALARAEAATRPSELIEKGSVNPIRIGDVIALVTDAMPPLAVKYASVRSNLDLLFYVNLGGILVDDKVPRIAFDSLGFRSVSVLTSGGSFVLAASANAPSFIRESTTGDVMFRRQEEAESSGTTHVRICFTNADGYESTRKTSNRALSLLDQAKKDLELEWDVDYARGERVVELTACWGLDLSGYQETLVPLLMAKVSELCPQFGLRVVDSECMP